MSPDAQGKSQDAQGKTAGLHNKPEKVFTGKTSSFISIAFSADGKTLAGGSNGSLTIWDVASGKELRTIADFVSWVHMVALTPDGKKVVSADDQNVKLWDVQTGKELHNFLTSQNSPYFRAALSADGKVLATSRANQTITVWDVNTGKALRSWPIKPGKLSSFAMSLAFSPDGKMIANSADISIKIWDVATGKELHALAGSNGMINSVAFSPDCTKLACTGEKAMELWDVASGKKLRKFAPGPGVFWDLAFRPGNKTLASTHLDETIKLWDISSGRDIATLKDHGSGLAFSPDGNTIAGAIGKAITKDINFWHLDSDQQLLANAPPVVLNDPLKVLDGLKDSDAQKVIAAVKQNEEPATSGLDPMYFDPTQDLASLNRFGADKLRVRFDKDSNLWLEGLKGGKVIFKKQFPLDDGIINEAKTWIKSDGQKILVTSEQPFHASQIVYSFGWNGHKLSALGTTTHDDTAENIDRAVAAAINGNPKSIQYANNASGYTDRYVDGSVISDLLKRGHARAMQLFKSGQAQVAASRLKLVFETSTTLVEMRGTQLEHTAGVDKWVEAWKSDGVSLQPDQFVEALNDYGYFLQSCGRDKEAVPVFLTVIDQDSSHAVAYLNLADSQWTLGNQKDARANYGQYISLMKAQGLAAKIPARVGSRCH
jgi:WD40 repeat protein